MALFWFFIGIVIILCIGRYNESNKLFWVLLVSFIGSFTAASIVVSVLRDNQDKESKNQVCPMQGLTNTSSNNIAYLADDLFVNKKATAKLAGKDNTSDNTFLTEGSSNDEQYAVKLLKPPRYDNIL